jgi:hypothetical protein
MRLPNEPVLNEQLTTAVGRPVITFEVIGVSDGDRITVRFIGKSGNWRQGIWIGVAGALEIHGTRADQFEIWADTAPPEFTVDVVRAEDGLMRLYNIWDSGRGRRRESQSATSGMLKEVVGHRTRYRAHDIGFEPAFDRLIFELERN